MFKQRLFGISYDWVGLKTREAKKKKKGMTTKCALLKTLAL
jgi:hypothetical protein